MWSVESQNARKIQACFDKQQFSSGKQVVVRGYSKPLTVRSAECSHSTDTFTYTFDEPRYNVFNEYGQVSQVWQNEIEAESKRGY